MARPAATLFARAGLRRWRMTGLQIALAVCSFLAALAVPGPHFRADADPVAAARSPWEGGALQRMTLASEGLPSILAGIGNRSEGPSVLREPRDSRDLQDPHDLNLHGPNAARPAYENGAAAGGILPATAAAAAAASAVVHATYRQPGEPDGVGSKLAEQMRWIASTPSIAPVRGVVTSGFGYRNDPLTHGPGIHQGIDIAAAPGQPVHASAEGIVVRAGETSGLGLAVYVEHAYGLSTRYGHMSEIDVRPGQHVRRGDVVGRVGNTGRSTGYHLHYEVRVSGEPVDPLGYIPEDGSGPF